MNPDSVYLSPKWGIVNWTTIPFQFILRFFCQTIPESIPENRPKMAKESELLFFWNRNQHSPNRYHNMFVIGQNQKIQYHPCLGRSSKIGNVRSFSPCRQEMLQLAGVFLRKACFRAVTHSTNEIVIFALPSFPHHHHYYPIRLQLLRGQLDWLFSFNIEKGNKHTCPKSTSFCTVQAREGTQYLNLIRTFCSMLK